MLTKSCSRLQQPILSGQFGGDVKSCPFYRFYPMLLQPADELVSQYKKMNKSNIAKFEKYDRFKANDYQAYNYKMPSIYDDCFWMKIFQIPLWDQNIITEIGENISSTKILDVGCATGRLLCKLGQNGAKKISGVDIAPNIIKKAKKNLEGINIKANLKTADVECKLPWDNNSFDCIILSGTIHHLFRPIDALSEIYRVLDKGGKLIIAESWFPFIIRHILNLWLLIFPHDGDYHFYTPTQMMQLISKVRMSHVNYKKVGYYSYLVTGSKN